MFKNTAHRTQSITQRLRAGWIFLALILALSLGSAGQTTPAQAAALAQDGSITNMFLHFKYSIPTTLCAGRNYRISITPLLDMDGTRMGGAPFSSRDRLVTGVQITAKVEGDESIATISPPSQTSSRIDRRDFVGLDSVMYTPGLGSVTFTLHALKGGTAALRLTGRIPAHISDRRQGFQHTEAIRVVNCKYKVQIFFSMYGFFSGTSGTAMGYMETTLTGDGEYYSGQGMLDVPESRTIPGCAISHSGFKSPTKIIGRLTDSQGARTLKLEIKYEPGQYYGSISCPHASASGSGSEDPSSILRTSEVFPENGGSKSERIDIAGWLGTSTIVVMPVESK